MESLSQRLGFNPKGAAKDQPAWRAKLLETRVVLHLLGPIVCGAGFLSVGVKMGDKPVPFVVTQVIVGIGVLMTLVAALLGCLSRLEDYQPPPPSKR